MQQRQNADPQRHHQQQGLAFRHFKSTHDADIAKHSKMIQNFNFAKLFKRRMSRLSSHLLVSNAYVNMKRKVNANARPLFLSTATHRSQKLVTFTDTAVSQVHEIPPKPKRTRHVEKRSRTVPIPPPHAQEEQAQIQSLEQRISLTSIEDLQKNSKLKPQFDSTKNLNQKEKDDLSKVRVMARHGTALRETETCRAASRSIITKVVGLIIDSISLL